MRQMIIANRLADGVVVFFDAGKGWTQSIEDGAVIETDEEARRLLSLAKADEAGCRVIDPNLIDIEVADGRRRPTSIREAIRAFGPTVRTDLVN